MSRLSALKKEEKIVDLSKMITSLFYQIDTEREFIEAISTKISNPDVSSLLWHSLKHLHDCESMAFEGAKTASFNK